ncbi:Mini-ribonuclease 3 [Seminavis robusta]|uniref:Mini-ribonuclease 3 n=1 Tax=Seminavis robusta TaxID=568900 RepID=A0A9N8DE42_9STRA|nr:Mini-ribonuclease 3 [Seminavis robusta]|eukprot:Sro105_g053350.1 Mini-ribonuclease 3 (215) ;mRNA; r:95266-96086
MGRQLIWEVILVFLALDLSISRVASFPSIHCVYYKHVRSHKAQLRTKSAWAPYSKSMHQTSGKNSADSSETSPNGSKSLAELLTPSKDAQPSQMSGTELAYIGDAVFELFIRSRHVWPSQRTSDLQDTVVSTVRAEHQSHLLQQIKEEFPLSEAETRVMMRGRNAVTRSKNRRNPAAYQDSTAFECLIGYMYIAEPPRCQELLNWLEDRVDNQQ